MKPQGLSKKAVLEELKNIRSLDKRYHDGKILCSMCTESNPIAKKAYQLLFDANLGDPGLFPGSIQLEKQVVQELAELLHSINSSGFLVSGGTEANLMAMLAARNMAKVSKPEVVLPESAHFSFTKICNMLNLIPVYASLDSSFRVIPSEIERRISKNTVAVIGTAGTPEFGAIDPISELSDIATRHDVHLHVDAAFGGLIIPFLANAKPCFDFSLEGVKSITVDPHKMGMAVIPTGGIIFKDTKALDSIKTETPYLTNKFQYTFVGTRTGASAASVWAVFKNLGLVGYQKIVDDCMKNTKLLSEGLEDFGFQLATKPTLNLVAFRSKNTKSLAEKLRNRGWFISYIPRYDCIRVVVMPHVKRPHIRAFLKDLREIENFNAPQVTLTDS